MDACQKVSGELIITGSDAAKMLEFIEEALDQVSFAVEYEIAGPRIFAVSLGWDDRSDAALVESFDKRVGVVSFVAQQCPWIDILDQRLRAGKIMHLTCRQHQFDRIAQGVYKRMDFGGQPSAGSADGLRTVFFRAPALC